LRKLEDEKYKKARECALRTPNLSLIAFDGAIIGRTSGNWSFNIDPKNNFDGIIGPISETSTDDKKVHELRLGDFFQFSNLLKGLANANESDEE